MEVMKWYGDRIGIKKVVGDINVVTHMIETQNVLEYKVNSKNLLLKTKSNKFYHQSVKDHLLVAHQTLNKNDKRDTTLKVIEK